MDRVEELVHEALTEHAAQADAYLSRFADRLSPGLGRQPLAVLLRVKRFGPLRPADLAVQMHLPLAEVEHHVEDLLSRRLAAREGAGAQTRIRLAEDVRDTLDLAEDERRGRILDSLETWSLEDKETFARLLAKFVQRDDLVVRALSLHARR